MDRTQLIVAFALVIWPIAAPVPAKAQTAVWTGHYDNFRSGANLYETVLTPANVNPDQFGKLAHLPVTGCVVSQPLYVPGVPAPDGSARNLVFIATSKNSIYAYDADDYSLQWTGNYGMPFPSTVVGDAANQYYDFLDCDPGDNNGSQGPIGISGTPVIDAANNSMYFVAATSDAAPRFHHMLHKISLTDGSDLLPAVDVAGSYFNVPFNSRYQLQRAALLLMNGLIYVPFSSHRDEIPYYGWVFSYDLNLNAVSVMNYSPSHSGAGIWQSGGGIASDGVYLYFNTGNNADGDADITSNSESVLQVDPLTLQAVAKTSFVPENDDWDWNFDLDLGSSRVIVMPGLNRIISGSKFGDIFSINQNGMMLEVRRQVAARHSSGLDWTGVYNGFAFWNRTIYVWPGGGGQMYGPQPPFPTDVLKAFTLTDDYSGLNIVANGQDDGTAVGYQGANLAISANGQDTTTGIVWAQTPTQSTITLQPAYLHAYNASDFSNGIFHELWNNTNDYDDNGCNHAKFSVPLIANGKVFLPTFSGRVIVYGLLDAGQTSQNPQLRRAAVTRRPDAVQWCPPIQ